MAGNAGVCLATSLLDEDMLLALRLCALLGSECVGRDFWRWCAVALRCVGLPTCLDNLGERTDSEGFPFLGKRKKFITLTSEKIKIGNQLSNIYLEF